MRSVSFASDDFRIDSGCISIRNLTVLEEPADRHLNPFRVDETTRRDVTQTFFFRLYSNEIHTREK